MILATALQRPFRSGWLLQRRRKDYFDRDGSCNAVAKTISVGMVLATPSQRPFRSGWLSQRRRKDHFGRDGSRDAVANLPPHGGKTARKNSLKKVGESYPRFQTKLYICRRKSYPYNFLFT